MDYGNESAGRGLLIGGGLITIANVLILLKPRTPSPALAEASAFADAPGWGKVRAFLMLRFLPCAGLFLVAAITRIAAADTLSFNRDIRPILSEKCYACHGPDEAARKAKLRLDVRDGGDEGTRRRARDRAGRPGGERAGRAHHQQGSGRGDAAAEGAPRALRRGTGEKLKAWIAEGAEYAPHWAFVAPAAPAVKKSRARHR